MGHPAYVLCGPTATGKTGLAHIIARQTGWPLLSADAMQVYRGMDIGTAKPTSAERQGLVYGGLDCASPDSEFSVGTYRAMALDFVSSLPDDQPVLVVGGTGLYIKALLMGLDNMPSANPDVRTAVQSLFEEQGLAGIQEACRALDPERYQRLRDPNNPRRVMRALELAKMGVASEGAWENQRIPGLVTVLDVEHHLLHMRIECRAREMFSGGLLDEARDLREQWPGLSRTAGKAIGYQEAFAVLAGEMDVDAAVAVTCTRTRQYARRQRTWFRHQLPGEFVAVDGAEPAELAAEGILSSWLAREACEIMESGGS